MSWLAVTDFIRFVVHGAFKFSYDPKGYDVLVYSKLPKDSVPLMFGSTERHPGAHLGTAKLTRSLIEPHLVSIGISVDLRDPISHAQSFFSSEYANAVAGNPTAKFWIQTWWRRGQLGLSELDRVELVDRHIDGLKPLW